MKKIIVRGPILSKSGYGTHSRQIFRWLLSLDHQVSCHITPWGITSWYVNPESLDGLIGQAMARSNSEASDSDVSIQIQLPHEWSPDLARFNVGVTAGVETDIAPSEWVDAIKSMNMVIVPSNFTKEGLIKAGAPPSKIKVVPESFSDSLLSQRESDLPEIDLTEITTKFNFLLFGQVTSMDPETDRKNLLYTVKWFCEEFEGNRDVGLIVKSNLGTNCVFHKEKLSHMFKSLVSEVRKGEYPKVYLLNGDMTDDECASLFHSSKVNSLLTLTRGEGYGLPIIDAAAAGLPIIATGWSGHMDYLRMGKFTKVNYTLNTIPHDKMEKSIFAKGSRWAMPIEEDAKKKMRKSYESQSVPKEWAKDLKEGIQRDYSFSAVSRIYNQAFKGILVP